MKYSIRSIVAALTIAFACCGLLGTETAKAKNLFDAIKNEAAAAVAAAAGGQQIGYYPAGSKADCQMIVQSEPQECEVYLNGQLVCESTPGVIYVSSKMAGKPLVFKFSKKGYETRSVIYTFTKKELKNTPTINCKLKAAPDDAYSHDASIPKGEAHKKVSRDNAGATALERAIIRWAFDSDPRGARVFYRVISNAPDQVKNTNESYLTTTPYEETKGFNIPGLSYENSRNVTIEIKVSKRGYEDQVKRYNVRQAIDQQEISGFFELVPKEDNERRRDDDRYAPAQQVPAVNIQLNNNNSNTSSSNATGSNGQAQ